MASYTAAEALHLIMDSQDDLVSGDESDIQEDPLFPLPRQDDSEEESEEGEPWESEVGEGEPGDEGAGEYGNEGEGSASGGDACEGGSESDEDAGKNKCNNYAC